MVLAERVTSPSLPSPYISTSLLLYSMSFRTSASDTAVTPLPSHVAVPMKRLSAGVVPETLLEKSHDSASEFPSLANVM